MVARVGIEPTTRGFSVRGFTAFHWCFLKCVTKLYTNSGIKWYNDATLQSAAERMANYGKETERDHGHEEFVQARQGVVRQTDGGRRDDRPEYRQDKVG